MKSETRRWLLRLHMMGGLVIALYAAALGLSGSVLVFREELQKPIATEPGAAPDTVDEVASVVREGYPEWRVLSVTWPNRFRETWMAYLLKGGESREAYVYKGGRVFDRVPAGWVAWLLRFHTNFHSGSTGRLLNGIGGLALIAMAGSGLLLWYRPKGGWRSWHHNTGLIASAFLLVMGVTGGYYVWQGHYIAAVDRLFPRTPSVSMPRHDPGAVPLTMSELTSRATKAIPGRRIFRASGAMDQPVIVTMLEGDELEFHKVSTVVLDPIDGAVLQVNRYDDRPLGNSILGWFSVLHFGRFAGLPGRILWFVLGLTLPVLSVTGLVMYWRKRAA